MITLADTMETCGLGGLTTGTASAVKQLHSNLEEGSKGTEHRCIQNLNSSNFKKYGIVSAYHHLIHKEGRYCSILPGYWQGPQRSFIKGFEVFYGSLPKEKAKQNEGEGQRKGRDKVRTARIVLRAQVH